MTIWLDARNGLLLRHSGDSVERLHTDNSKFGCEPGKRNIWEQLDMTFPKGEEIHRVTRETWNSTFRYLKKTSLIQIIFSAKIQNKMISENSSKFAEYRNNATFQIIFNLGDSRYDTVFENHRKSLIQNCERSKRHYVYKS